jgi:hypothetical protein
MQHINLSRSPINRVNRTNKMVGDKEKVIIGLVSIPYQSGQ